MPVTASRKRDWCFTIHAGHFGDKSEEQVIEDLKKVVCNYIVFQQETGAAREGGIQRDHIQGYVMFSAAKTMQQAKRLLPCDAHLEMRMAEKISDAVKYCKKDATRRPGCNFVEIGVQPMDQGVKRTLAEACQLAKEKGVKRVALEMPEEFVKFHSGLAKLAHIAAGQALPQQRSVKVYYIWGDSGCGKSHWAEHYDTPENTYSTGDMPDKIWFGDYSTERTLIIEEFEGLCSPSIMKRMLDGFKMEVQTKGGFAWAQWDTVILTSNYPPEAQYDAAKNWFSVPPTAPGPFQRRFNTGGIIHGTGCYEQGNHIFDKPLPARNEEEAEGDVGPPVSPMDLNAMMETPAPADLGWMEEFLGN